MEGKDLSETCYCSVLALHGFGVQCYYYFLLEMCYLFVKCRNNKHKIYVKLYVK